MSKKHNDVPDGHETQSLSRRALLMGASATALVVAASPARAAPQRGARTDSDGIPPGEMPSRRYMAAAAALGDGRLLITGGYDRPWRQSKGPAALSSTMIFDPNSGQWVGAAPMGVPRARHVAISLPDGRVAVLGGVSTRPTASVEIYDPRTDRWEMGEPLDQPRYDHTAVSNGQDVYVLGGSSQSMVSAVEVYRHERPARGSNGTWEP